MTKPSTTGRRIRRAAANLALAAGLLIAVLTLGPALLGYERYVITGGSMGDTYERGSVLYSETVPPSELEVGDVITYSPPRGSGPEGMVTHRIASIRRDAEGHRLYRTKGDANEAADPWRFRLENPTQARASFSVPFLGYVLGGLSVRPARVVLIGVPALLIALTLLAGLWREAGEELRRRERGLGEATSA